MGLPLFLPATNTAAVVAGAGAPREPAGGRGPEEGGRGGGCATSASPRSIFKAPSGLGQPPALPSLAPARPPPLQAAAPRQPPGHRGDGEGPRAAPPPRGLGLCAQRGSGTGRGPGSVSPALAFLGSFSLTPSGLLGPAFCPIHMTSQLRRAYALMHK